MTSTARRVPSTSKIDYDNLIPIERVEDIPESFASEAEEAEYWDTHDTGPILDQLEDVTHSPPPGLRRRTDPHRVRARKRPASPLT